MKRLNRLHKKKEKYREADISSRIVIITGLSGSGKTVALRAVEDSDFFCVDNLPISLINALITKISANKKSSNIAIGVDIREKEFLSDIDKVLNLLRGKYNLEIVFLEAETDVLMRRFKETRRPHPLGGKLEDAIKAERESLSKLKEYSDRVIDTSSFTPHELRNHISSLFFPLGSRKEMTVNLISFGFKHGVPQNIDILLDVRFLPNPNFVPALRSLNGKDRRVSDFVFKHRVSKEFRNRLRNLLDFLLPLYIKEGKTYLSIAIGCTGGNHRSPAIVEYIAKFIKKKSVELNIIHRDMS